MILYIIVFSLFCLLYCTAYIPTIALFFCLAFCIFLFIIMLWEGFCLSDVLGRHEARRATLITHRWRRAGRGSLGNGNARFQWWWPDRRGARSSSPGRKRRLRWPSHSRSPEPHSKASPWCRARSHAQLLGDKFGILVGKVHRSNSITERRLHYFSPTVNDTIPSHSLDIIKYNGNVKYVIGLSCITRD